MKRTGKRLSGLQMGGAGLVALAVLVCAFVFWLLGSENGTRILITRAVQEAGGRAAEVQGSLLGGVSVGRLSLSLPAAAISIVNLRLDVNWRDIIRRRLHVRELSAQALHVALNDSNEPAKKGGALPALPLQVAIDKLAIDQFALARQGQDLPLQINGLQASLTATATGAELHLVSLHLQHEVAQADLQGRLELQALAEPWPFTLNLNAVAHGAKDNFLASSSAVALELDAAGSLQEVSLQLKGSGEGMSLDAVSTLAPAAAMPLLSARVDLHLAGGSSLSATLAQQPLSDAESPFYRLSGKLAVDGLDLGRLLGAAYPPALLTAQANLDAQWQGLFKLKHATLALTVAPASRWNGEPLSADIKGEARIKQEATAGEGPAVVSIAQLATAFELEGLEMHLRLGANRLRAQGGWGHTGSGLKVEAEVPQLASFWPSLSGAAAFKGTLEGTPSNHRGDLTLRYVPVNPRSKGPRQDSFQAALRFAGAWTAGASDTVSAAEAGWRGTLSQVKGQYAGFNLALDRPLDLAFFPGAVAPQWQWQVGRAGLVLTFPGRQRLSIDHTGSRGGEGRWETAGKVNNLAVTAAMVRQIATIIDPHGAAGFPWQSPSVNKSAAEAERRIALDGWWTLRFAGALSGQARLTRREGDVRIPGDPPLALGLQALTLDLAATPVSPSASRAEAKLTLATAQMGRLEASGSAILTALTLDRRQPLRVKLDAEMKNMVWLGLLTGDKLEIDGAFKVNLQAQGTLGGQWRTQGTLRGDKLRAVRIDEGVRLVDGTLSARLEDEMLIVDMLRFPASLRVLPAERRMREWVTHDPEAQGGYLEAGGVWDLWQSSGQARINLYRFPALQRADRYAMVSGQVHIEANLPRIAITGAIKADAGWASLEILRGVPTLDDDVQVRRADGKTDPHAPRLDLNMDLNADMGSRFYITGMGLDASLLGAIHIQTQDGRLNGMGALHTRGGIEAYGQKLKLRRGTLTFQGKLDNPVLDIEALRTGQQVEAGVKVGGTAQRPRIDLVSQPDVSEVEKLSWLILGRGPDESGSDAALLLSVGNALLGGGQPFYKQFGLDEISIRSGAIGSSGSLLPDQTVAGSTNQDSNRSLATQFLVASKRFSNGITLSIEQALSGTDTVGRLSYRLRRGLSLDLKGGAVNGIAVVYKLFFDN